LQMTVPARPKAPKLTADDLRELGIAALGHRRLLLEAIAVCLAESGRVEGAFGRVRENSTRLARFS